jgi:hypothetical protein
MSTEADIKFHLGEDWTVDFVCEDASGDASNITGATLRWRMSTLAGTTVMTRTEADGITITGGSSGLCRLRVTPTHQTTGSVAGATRYQWEFRAVTAGSVTTVHARGHINVLPSLLAS